MQHMLKWESLEVPALQISGTAGICPYRTGKGAVSGEHREPSGETDRFRILTPLLQKQAMRDLCGF